MARSDRIFALMTSLRDGHTHRAQDLAASHGVSERTIYRDMATLAASGYPVSGTPGTGYRAARGQARISLSVTPEELDALQLAVAVVSEAADPGLAQAATALAEKIDASLDTTAAPGGWDLAAHPFADAARGLSHMAPLRAAIVGRQKLQLVWITQDGERATARVRPLALTRWGRLWMLSVWNESRDGFEDIRVDLVETVQALPELFLDEAGKRLADRPSG